MIIMAREHSKKNGLHCCQNSEAWYFPWMFMYEIPDPLYKNHSYFNSFTQEGWKWGKWNFYSLFLGEIAGRRSFCPHCLMDCSWQVPVGVTISKPWQFLTFPYFFSKEGMWGVAKGLYKHQQICFLQLYCLSILLTKGAKISRMTGS